MLTGIALILIGYYVTMPTAISIVLYVLGALKIYGAFLYDTKWRITIKTKITKKNNEINNKQNDKTR